MEAKADDNPQSVLKTVRKKHILHLIRVQGDPKTNTPKFGKAVPPLAFDKIRLCLMLRKHRCKRKQIEKQLPEYKTILIFRTKQAIQ